MTYSPKPINTTHIVLPPELEKLTEKLAENAHDLWAAERFKNGWTYGPERDDRAKKHPCLVPYRELPDGEKQYDRQTVIGTLKGILALGFVVRGSR